MGLSSGLSIRDKLLITPLISAVLFMILYLTFIQFSPAHSTTSLENESNNLLVIQQTNQLSINLMKEQIDLSQLLLPSVTKQQNTQALDAIEQIRLNVKTYAENIDELTKLSSLEPSLQAQIVKNLHSKHKQYQSDAKNLLDSIVERNLEPTTFQTKKASTSLLLQTNASLKELITTLEQLSNMLGKSPINQNKQTENILAEHGLITLITIIFIILIIGIGLYLANHLSSSIDVINSAMISLANNDLDIDLPEKENSNLNQLAHAVTQFKLSLEKNRSQNIMLTRSLEQLKETNERYFSFLDITAIAILAINNKQEIVLFNKTAEQVFGYNKEEVIGQSLSMLLPIKYRGQHHNIVDNFSHSNLEYIAMQPKDSIQGLKKNGEQFLIEAHVSKLTLANETLMTAAITDITERKRTVEALADSERQQRDILNNTSCIIYVKDLQGRYLFVNDMFEKLFHLKDDVAKGRTDYDIFPSDIADALRVNDVMVASNQSLMELEEVNHVDGIERNYFSVKFPLRNRAGDIYAISGISTDITDRKRTEQRLIRSEARFRSLFQSAVVGIIVAGDKQGLIKEWNNGAQRIFGYSAKEILNRPLSLLIPEHHSTAHQHGYNQAYKKGGLNRGGTTHELTGIRKNGEEFPLALTLSTWKEGSSQHFSAMLIDITARKDAETKLKQHQDHLEDLIEERTEELQASFDNLTLAQNQLVESEKMAALGGLVAGISHEINTPIGIGVTAASHLADMTEDFAKHYESGELTEEHVSALIQTNKEVTSILLSNMHRAAGLIRSFKQVAVDQSSEATREFELQEYMNEILTSLKPKFKNKPYEIKINCPHKIMLNSVPGAIAQVFTNLLMNSLIHGFEQQDSGEIIIDIIQNKHQVEISYRDSGKGIPAEHLDKIFEPFFTTRRGKGGSGLGMHIVYNLVTKSLGGSIFCSSKLGSGTHFDIKIPVTTDKPSLPS